MALRSTLATRERLPEIMDDPQLAPARHELALRGLARLNLLSASPRILWRPIAKLARHLRTDRLRVLDIATGGGDIPLALWRRARRAGLALDILGVDISPQALNLARDQAQSLAAPVQFAQLDALSESLPSDYDVIISSLFLHHLDEPDAVRLLRAMSAATRRMILVNDLRRGRAGLMLAYAASRLFSRSDVVHVDALLSVRAAFKIDEALALAHRAGLSNVDVSRCWPCRYLLSWSRS